MSNHSYYVAELYGILFSTYLVYSVLVFYTADQLKHNGYAMDHLTPIKRTSPFTKKTKG